MRAFSEEEKRVIESEIIDCRAVMKAVIVSMIVFKLKVSSTFYQPPFPPKLGKFRKI